MLIRKIYKYFIDSFTKENGPLLVHSSYYYGHQFSVVYAKMENFFHIYFKDCLCKPYGEILTKKRFAFFL